MAPEPTRFQGRSQAGRMLAEALAAYGGREDVVVVGLPRGGVAIAAEVARSLHAPLDAIVVRKLGVPGWEKLAMGAIASGGVRILNDDVLAREKIVPEEVRAATLWQMAELHRLETRYRGCPGAPNVEGKTVLLVDDGIATGATMRSAVRALLGQDPRSIVIAAPVASREGLESLRPMVDALFALVILDDLAAVGPWYESLGPVSDDEVTRLLAEAGHEPAGA